MNLVSMVRTTGSAPPFPKLVPRVPPGLTQARPADPPASTYPPGWAARPSEKLDLAALVISPTGVGLGRNGVLYVADTLASRVAAIPDAVSRGSSAGRGLTVSTGHHLNGELGLAIAPAVTS